MTLILIITEGRLIMSNETVGKLSDKRKKEIETTVNRILSENGIHFPGFDVARFLSEKCHFSIAQQPMTDGTTGLLFINDNECLPHTSTHKLIVVNSNLRNEPNFAERRRFIISHEFAHSVLHKNSETLYAHRDASEKNTPEELEADFFARSFLMPTDLVSDILNANYAERMNDDDKIALISRTFNVTEKKARIRLHEDLSLI